MALFLNNVNKFKLTGSMLNQCITLSRSGTYKYNRLLSSEAFAQQREKTFEKRGHANATYTHMLQNKQRYGVLDIKNIVGLMEDVKQQGLANTSQILFLIQSCGYDCTRASAEEKNNLVNQIWTMLQELDVKMDISHYNALLQVYNENEYTFSPVEFLKQIEIAKLAPNRVTYARLIHAYCQEGNISGANGILEKMKELNMPINVNIFNSFILGNARAKDLDGIAGVIEVMKKSEIELGFSTNSTLFSCYAELNDLEKARAVVADCHEKDINISGKNFMEGMYYFGIHDNMEAIKEFVDNYEKPPGFVNDAMQAIKKLLVRKKLEPAEYLALQFEGGAVNYPKMKFYPSQLVAHIDDVDVVAKSLATLYDNDQQYAYVNALHEYLVLRNPEKTLQFLRIMKSCGQEICDHYLSPFFVSLKGLEESEKIKYASEALNLLDTSSKFHLVNFLCPLFDFGSNPGEVYTKLSQNIDERQLQHLYEAVVEHIANVHGFDLAARFDKEFNYPLSNHGMLTFGKIYGDQASPDAKGYVHFLIRIAQQAPVDVDNDHEEIETFYAFKTMLKKLGRKDTSLVSSLLKEMKKQKFFLSKNQIASLKHTIDDFPSCSIVDSMKYRSDGCIFFHNKNPDEGRRDFMDDDKGAMINNYINEDNANGLEELLNEIRENDLEVAIPPAKLIACAKLLLKWDKIDGAIKMIQDLSKNNVAPLDSSRVLPVVDGLAKVCAAHVDATKFKLIDEAFQELSSYTDFRNNLVFRYHIYKEDLEGAWNLYKDDQNLMNAQVKILKLAVMQQNTEIMQEIVNITADKEGENVALHHLGFMFIECDKTKQARKVFQAHGFRVSPNRVFRRMHSWLDRGYESYAENLLSVTADIFKFEREPLFSALLNYYISEGKCEKALGLWTQLQDEGLYISKAFLNNLGQFLQKEGYEVPFEIPSDHNTELFGSISEDSVKLLTQNKVFEAVTKLDGHSYSEKNIIIAKVIDAVKIPGGIYSAIDYISTIRKKNRHHNYLGKFTMQLFERTIQQGEAEALLAVLPNFSHNFLSKAVQAIFNEGPHLENKIFSSCETLSNKKQVYSAIADYYYSIGEKEKFMKILQDKNVTQPDTKITIEKFMEGNDFNFLDDFIQNTESILVRNRLHIAKIRYAINKDYLEEASRLIRDNIDSFKSSKWTIRPLNRFKQDFDSAGKEFPCDIPLLHRESTKQENE